YLAADNHVHELGWYNNRWNHRDLTADAGAIPAVSGSPLSVITISNDDPRVYYLGVDQHVHELAWKSLTHVWYHTDVSAAGGGLLVDPDSKLGTTTVNSQPLVYYMTADKHIHELKWSDDGWIDEDILANVGESQAAS